MAGYGGHIKRRIAYSKLKKDPVTGISSTKTRPWLIGLSRCSVLTIGLLKGTPGTNKMNA